MNKKIFTFSLVMITSFVLFSSCSHINNSFDSTTSDQLEQKNDSFSLTGVMSKNGDVFFLTDSTGAIHDIESYSVDFESYLGNEVTVSGEYSGNTFFVTQVTQ